MILKCNTHGVTVSYDGNHRVYQTQSGSWGSLEQCQIFLLKDLKPGTYDKCVIVEGDK